MQPKIVNTEGTSKHDDFILKWKWLSLVTGNANSRSPAYKYYILVLYLLYIFFLGAACATLIVTEADKELFVRTFHVIMLIIMSALLLSCRILFGASFREMGRRVYEGVYHYDPPDAGMERILEEGFRMRKRRSDVMATLYLIPIFSNLVVHPLTQLMTVSEEEAAGPLNPYLHEPMYMPFDTRHPTGYIAGAFLNIIYTVVIYGVGTTLAYNYISYSGTLATQLRMLNYSLENLHARADRIYSKGRKSPAAGDFSALNGEREYYDCLLSCLKSNIEHHLAICEFKKVGRVYFGSTLFLVLTISGIIMATNLSLLLEELPPTQFANYMMNGISEVGYAFLVCYFGEEVLEESSRTFFSLYNTPWIIADKRFKKSLMIMMANTREPMKIKSLILDIEACLSTYGDIISSMYKIINLIRRHKQGKLTT